MAATAEAPARKKTAREANAEYNEAVAEREEQIRLLQHHAENADIYKVSYIENKVSIKYILIENNKNNEFTMESDDAPCEAFIAALHSLAPHAAEIFIMDAGERAYWTKYLTVKGVSFSYKGKFLQAQVSINRQLESGHCFNIVLPTLLLEPENDSERIISRQMADILHDLIAEARLYIAGKRAQGTLPFTGSQGDGDSEEDAE